MRRHWGGAPNAHSQGTSQGIPIVHRGIADVVFEIDILPPGSCTVPGRLQHAVAIELPGWSFDDAANLFVDMSDAGTVTPA